MSRKPYYREPYYPMWDGYINLSFRQADGGYDVLEKINDELLKTKRYRDYYTEAVERLKTTSEEENSVARKQAEEVIDTIRKRATNPEYLPRLLTEHKYESQNEVSFTPDMTLEDWAIIMGPRLNERETPCSPKTMNVFLDGLGWHQFEMNDHHIQLIIPKEEYSEEDKQAFIEHFGHEQFYNLHLRLQINFFYEYLAFNTKTKLHIDRVSDYRVVRGDCFLPTTFFDVFKAYYEKKFGVKLLMDYAVAHGVKMTGLADECYFLNTDTSHFLYTERYVVETYDHVDDEALELSFEYEALVDLKDVQEYLIRGKEYSKDLFVEYAKHYYNNKDFACSDNFSFNLSPILNLQKQDDEALYESMHLLGVTNFTSNYEPKDGEKESYTFDVYRFLTHAESYGPHLPKEEWEDRSLLHRTMGEKINEIKSHMGWKL